MRCPQGPSHPSGADPNRASAPRNLSASTSCNTVCTGLSWTNPHLRPYGVRELIREPRGQENERGQKRYRSNRPTCYGHTSPPRSNERRTDPAASVWGPVKCQPWLQSAHDRAQSSYRPGLHRRPLRILNAESRRDQLCLTCPHLHRRNLDGSTGTSM